jgi:hypothetical protein
MADARRGARFPPEPLAHLIGGEPGAQSLERNRPAQARILRGIDDAHAAFANFVEDAISTEALPHQVMVVGGYAGHSIVAMILPPAVRPEFLVRADKRPRGLGRARRKRSKFAVETVELALAAK